MFRVGPGGQAATSLTGKLKIWGILRDIDEIIPELLYLKHI